MITQAIQTFFSSYRFPVVVLSTMGLLAATTVGVLLIPPSDSALAAFAEDFKVWCFGYDPSTGEMEWSYVGSFLLQPLLMSGIVFLVWNGALKRATRAQITRYSLATVLAAGGLSGTLIWSAADLGSAQDLTEQPFPAERLRTHFLAPDFTLTDQTGEFLSLDSLQGEVFLVTAVFSSCGLTCPLIFSQTKRVLEGLTSQERARMKVAVITLDPENDTPEVLAELARFHGVGPPLFHLLTGDPARVNDTLDRFGFARTRDPQTEIIDHANLMILVDKGGRVAYRFTLGKRQEEWMSAALKLLIQEVPST